MNLTIWIICAALAGIIGASKNAGGAKWAAIGFLFGPIGLLCSLFAKGEPTNEDAN